MSIFIASQVNGEAKSSAIEKDLHTGASHDPAALEKEAFNLG